jgi:hypothetical protein
VTEVESPQRPTRRVGSVRPPVNKPALPFADFLKAVPEHPIAVDNTDGVTYGLDRNSDFGVCVPTGLDNLRRTVTKLLTGTEVDATWDDIKAWYRSQNPDFDENDPGGPGDQGMAIQDFLAWAVKQGLILGFAKVDPRNDDELQAAIYLFLGLHCGAVLQQAQEEQTDAGEWDYVAGSPDWGGHCFVPVAYETGPLTYSYETGALIDVITWQERVRTTRAWRQMRLSEAYVVILPEHVQHAGFRAGFDLAKYAAAFTQITGRPFPADVTPPEPRPRPVGLEAAAFALAGDPIAVDWAMKQVHSGHAKHVATLVRAVIRAAA